MRRFLLLCLMLAVTSACGSDDTNPITSDSLAGSYDLASLTTTSGGSSVTLQPPNASGVLVLTENRYSSTITFALPEQSIVQTLVLTGGYTRSGNSLQFTPDGGGAAFSAQVQNENQRLTFSAQGVTVVFNRAS